MFDYIIISTEEDDLKLFFDYMRNGYWNFRIRAVFCGSFVFVCHGRALTVSKCCEKFDSYNTYSI